MLLLQPSSSLHAGNDATGTQRAAPNRRNRQYFSREVEEISGGFFFFGFNELN